MYDRSLSFYSTSLLFFMCKIDVPISLGVGWMKVFDSDLIGKNVCRDLKQQIFTEIILKILDRDLF